MNEVVDNIIRINVVLVFQLVLEKTCDGVSWGFLNRVIERKYCGTRA
jgi:hypothetical protein